MSEIYQRILDAQSDHKDEQYDWDDDLNHLADCLKSERVESKELDEIIIKIKKQNQKLRTKCEKKTEELKQLETSKNNEVDYLEYDMQLEKRFSYL